MVQKNHRFSARKLLALFGATTLAIGAALTASAAAQADDPPPVPPVGNIVGTSGTLTIHKHAGNPTGPGTGAQIPTANLGVGIDGVTFNIQRVANAGPPETPIDLTTTAGWNQAKQASDGFNASTGALPAGFVVESATSVTTSGGGIATANLAFGLYRVTEQPNPAVDQPAQSFLVTLPYPNNNAWLYDVHVYPKNKLKDNHSKTVSTPVDTSGIPAVVEGSRVTWTITAPVPRPASGSTYTQFSVTDVLDPKLKYVSAVVKLDGAVQTEGPDTFSLNHTGANGEGNGGTVTLTLQGSTLTGLKAGQVVVVELVTEVHGVGEIQNVAVRNVNGVTTNIGTPQTNWGKVKVLKSNPAGAKLAGAKFELYKADKTTLVYAEQTTDGNGEILFDAVWLGNGTDKEETYCLKETQAPPGYITPTGDAAWTCVVVDTNGTAVKEVPVNNTQQTGPNLPMTGSTGTVAFMAGGIALIALAAGAGVMAVRRRDQAHHQ